MKCAQHAAYNPKFEKDGIIQTSPVAAMDRLKDPPTWLKVATTQEIDLQPWAVDFYHYPVTVWAYSTPQPNTEVPAPTGGQNKLRRKDSDRKEYKESNLE